MIDHHCSWSSGGCGRAIGLSALLMGLWSSLSLHAAEFQVTSSVWGTASEVGTFAWAVAQANSTPGVDTIRVQAGLQIDVDNAATVPGGEVAWLAKFTESTIVQGNGAKLVGNPRYVTTGGLIATKTNVIGSAYSPPIVPGDIVTVPGVSFALIGEIGQDNSGVQVSVTGLNADGLGSLARVERNATLTYNASTFDNIVNYTSDSGRSAFEAYQGSTVNLDSISMNRNLPFGDFVSVGSDYAIFNGSLAGTDSTLNMTRSRIDSSYGAGAILWTGGTANVVSSILSDSGGIQISDSQSMDGVLNFTNSIMYVQDGGETLQQTSRIIAGADAVANLTGSTVLYNSLFASGGSNPYDYNGMPLTAALNGTLNVNSSAIVPLNFDTIFPDNDAYSEFTGGNLVSDDYSFIGATAAQSGPELHAIFGNSNFLTDGLTFDLEENSGLYYLMSLPNGATPLADGVLVNVIPNAGSGGINELINPIDGQPILSDVFGNARTSAGGFRNIGAIQATVPEPSSLALIASGTLVLVWFGRRRNRRSA